MQIIRISDIHHPRFGEVWHLYQNSFPLCEQRTLDHQITAFKADRFHLDVYLDGETLVGFIGYWDFDDYLYIEHYAINSDLRGGGWGSRILEALQKTAGKTIILEIDEVVDEISTRRLRVVIRRPADAQVITSAVLRPVWLSMPASRPAAAIRSASATCGSRPWRSRSGSARSM